MLAVTTATKLGQYMTCPCSLYLDLHGPQGNRAKAHAFAEHLRQLGIEHEQRVADQLPHVPIPEGPIEQRAAWTVTLMGRGVERIRHPALVADGLAGVPDFLERVDIPSTLGVFAYRPVDVKISVSPKSEDVAQLAAYAIILGHVQGVVPETGDPILVDGSRVTVDLREPAEEVRRILPDVRAIIEGRAVSPTLSAECGMCPWHDHCLRTLCESHDISLIDGLGRAKKENLIEAGFHDLSAVAAAGSEDLSRCRGISLETAGRMIVQAQTLLEGKPRIVSSPCSPAAELELYVDMECQQGTQMIYLIGVLECEEGRGDQFLAFVADTPEDEGEMWERFLAYVRGLPRGSVIYHYHNFEATHLRKLADRHGIDTAAEMRLFGHLIDLHRVLKDSVVLPVHSYGLKPVAKWMGFRWRETGADAAMSMLWFDMWLSSGDRSHLEASIRYNEDDCRATKMVKGWLVSAAVEVGLEPVSGQR